MKGIKNILFDLGGVILQLDRPRCIHNFVQLGLHNIDQLTGPYSQDGIFMELEEGTISPEQFRDKVRLEVGNPLTDKQIDDAWNSFLVSVPAAHLELLLRLRREGYKVYLLSNTNHIHWQWCLEHVFNRHGHSIHDYFDNLFLSYELHLRKPGAAIFQAVINHTDMLPEETFFIDDSLANCETAQSLGIRTHTPRPGDDWTYLFK